MWTIFNPVEQYRRHHNYEKKHETNMELCVKQKSVEKTK